MIDKWGLGPLGKRTAAANSLSLAIGNNRRNATPTFIRVPYSDLIPPDPALEQQDSSSHYEALQAFAYQLSKEMGDAPAIREATAEPSAWIRAKAACANVMLSAGAELAGDLQAFNRHKVEGTMRVVEAMISKSRSEQ